MLVLMSIEDMLSDLGCAAIASASTIDDALALIDAGHFDLATLDVNLGGKRSDPVADALTASGVPFVFSTGYVDHMEPRFAARPLLQKPYRVEAFNAVVAGLVAEAAASS